MCPDYRGGVLITKVSLLERFLHCSEYILPSSSVTTGRPSIYLPSVDFVPNSFRFNILSPVLDAGILIQKSPAPAVDSTEFLVTTCINYLSINLLSPTMGYYFCKVVVVSSW